VAGLAESLTIYLLEKPPLNGGERGLAFYQALLGKGAG
jgi:hypothetical protein